MRTCTSLGLSLLFTLTLAHPAGAADKLSVRTLGARLAAKPTGAEAERLPRKSAIGSARTGPVG